MFVDKDNNTLLEFGGFPYSTRYQANAYRFVLTQNGTLYMFENIPELYESFHVGNVDKLFLNNPNNAKILETKLNVSIILKYLEGNNYVYNSLIDLQNLPNKVVPSDGMWNSVEIFGSFKMNCPALNSVCFQTLSDLLRFPEWEAIISNTSKLKQTTIYLNGCLVILNLYKVLHDACNNAKTKEIIKRLIPRGNHNFDKEKFFNSKELITKSNMYNFKTPDEG